MAQSSSIAVLQIQIQIEKNTIPRDFQQTSAVRRLMASAAKQRGQQELGDRERREHSASIRV